MLQTRALGIGNDMGGSSPDLSLDIPVIVCAGCVREIKSNYVYDEGTGEWHAECYQLRRVRASPPALPLVRRRAR